MLGKFIFCIFMLIFIPYVLPNISPGAPVYELSIAGGFCGFLLMCRGLATVEHDKCVVVGDITYDNDWRGDLKQTVKK